VQIYFNLGLIVIVAYVNLK